MRPDIDGAPRFCPFCRDATRATVKLVGRIGVVHRLTKRPPRVVYVCENHFAEGVNRVR